MPFQKKVWFHTCAALLKTGCLSGLPATAMITSSRLLPSRSVPATSLFSVSTYVLWCFP